MIESKSRAAAIVEEAASELGLSDQATERARGHAERAELEHPINGVPQGIAAGAIYVSGLMEGEKRTQREVADACDVTEVTVRRFYQEIIVYDTPYEPEKQNETSDARAKEGLVDRIRGWIA